MIDVTGFEVAIIGIACRFPGAADKDAFWNNLANGRHALTRFDDAELILSGMSIDDVLDPDRVKAGPVLDGVYDFDPAFFNIPDTEAVIMDPQQRQFLSCAWEAFEDAGYVPGDSAGSVGVFAGATHNTYLLREIWPAFERYSKRLGEPLVIMSNQTDFLPTRVSYKLNLRGPSVSISTACSTSLVATHYACRSLQMGECDLALAGGVAISFPDRAGYRRYGDNNGSISKDGVCRPFHRSGEGMVPANGVGTVLLKRLEDAVRDHDHIYAAIRGSAVNNDGASKVGFLAPSVEGQAQAIKIAMDLAAVSAQEISFIEAHGTGTLLGDPIEIRALAEAFGGEGAGASTCAVGSVKSNIGHVQEAAGIAGLIKATLAIKHRTLPASLHADEINPGLHLDDTPFFIAREPIDWRDHSRHLVAGVSSFGLGGTNAHVVLAEAPKTDKRIEGTSVCLLPVTARTGEQLKRHLELLADYLEREEPPLANVAYTLQIGRKHFAYRKAFVAGNLREAITLMRTAASASADVEPFVQAPKIAFYIPDDPRPCVEAARSFYGSNAAYHAEVDAILTACPDAEAMRLQRIFDSAGGLVPQGDDEGAIRFVAYSALCAFWHRTGIFASAIGGHGVGDSVGLSFSGTIELAEAMLRARKVSAAMLSSNDQPAAADVCSTSPRSRDAHDERSAADAKTRAKPIYVQQGAAARHCAGAGSRPDDVVARLALDADIVLPIAFSGYAPEVAPERLFAIDAAVSPERDADRRTLGTLGQLWEIGCSPIWSELYAGSLPWRTPLATYPFEARPFRPDIRDSEIPALQSPANAVPERRSGGPRTADEFRIDNDQDLSAKLRTIISRLWQELLGLDDPPTNVSFFDAGGDSLLVFRLTNALRDTFSVEFGARDIFEHASISQQCALVEARLQEKIESLTADEVKELISEH